jgi:hypothetical protein
MIEAGSTSNPALSRVAHQPTGGEDWTGRWFHADSSDPLLLERVKGQLERARKTERSPTPVGLSSIPRCHALHPAGRRRILVCGLPSGHPGEHAHVESGAAWLALVAGMQRRA